MVFSFRRTTIAPRVAAAIAAAAVFGAVETVHSAQNLAVEAQLQGKALAISARATIHAPLPLIWRTLTDYDHLAEFIPGMKSSRVLERRARPDGGRRADR
jgi:uncharacterized membrane protein